jgi:circadian clock protein KaiB
LAKKHQFILFVSGMSDKSAHAIENLHKIGDTYYSGDYEIEIIDIARDREQALNFQIIGIPTLIRVAPNPKRIILGDLSNKEKVLRLLDII